MINSKKVIGGFCGVLGLVIVRILASHLGANGYLQMEITVIALLFLIIIGFLLSKQYLVVVSLSFPLLALIIVAIGIYLDNIYLAIGGVSFIIIYMNLLPSFLRRYKSKKKSY